MKSLDELACLLSPEEQGHFYKEGERKVREEEHLNRINYAKFDGRPRRLQTINRVIPQLPMWMRRKIIEAKELYGHSDWTHEDSNMWNHVLTFQLDDKHTVTFTLMEVDHNPEYLNEDIKTMIGVYRDLQTLLRLYGFSLTIVCLNSYEFSMSLPVSFYNNKNDNEDYTSTDVAISPFDRFVNSLKRPYRLHLKTTTPDSIEFAETLNENEKSQFYKNCGTEYIRRLDYLRDMCNILNSSKYNYHGELMWEGVDLYMDNRWYGREFCVKWVIGDSLNKLTQIDKLRPVINKIIRKAGFHSFAFGVKPNDTTVTTCLPPILD